MAVLAPTSPKAVAIGPKQINLTWVNGQDYGRLYIERKVASGSWAPLGSYLPGTATSFSDKTVVDGTKYYYRFRGWYWPGAPIMPSYSDYSAEASATTPLPAPAGLGGYSNAGGTEAPLSWLDLSQNEASFKVFQDGVLIYTPAANATGYTATGLTPGKTYVFTVKAYNAAAGYSPPSNALSLTMADPPMKPALATATPTDTTKIQLNWKDTSDNEVDFHIELSSTSASAGFSEIATVAKNIRIYEVTGLTSGQQYWIRIRAHNAAGYSGYSNVATARPFADIAAPANLVCSSAKVGGSLGVEITFDDYSALEDGHSLERKTGAGAYSELVLLGPNRTYYHDATAVTGTMYTYRVRAKQGAAYSDYSDEVAITVQEVPFAAPGGLAVSEYQDVWAILGWMPAYDEEGFSIELSTTSAVAGFAEVLRVLGWVTSMKVPGLTASTQYWFRVRGYNAAGYSAYSDVVTVTTRAVPLPSKFEKLLRRTAPAIVFRVKANPLIPLSGWALYEGATYAYLATPPTPYALSEVFENGVKLRHETWFADVETDPGTWYQAAAGEPVYVHSLGDDSPENYLMTASIWMPFTTGHTAWFDGDRYLPLVPTNGIPDVSESVEPFWEGGFSISTGTVRLLNPWLYGEYFWDRRWAQYRWRNRRIVVDAGGEDFAHSEFVPIFAGTINSKAWGKNEVEFELRDLRDSCQRNVPAERYTLAEFPNLDPSLVDQVRPEHYGVTVGASANRIDTENNVFEFNRGRVKTVTATLNAADLVEDTDFFVDYQRGRLTLARGLAYEDQDILLVSFTGGVNLADEALTNGAEIFRAFHVSSLQLTDDDLDLYSIYETKNEKTAPLAIHLVTETPSQDVVRMIERSLGATSFQTADGRIGLRAVQTAAATDAKYIQAARQFDLKATLDQANIWSAVDIYYAGSPDGRTWSVVTKPVNRAIWEHGVQKVLPVYTALTAEADANDLGALIVALLDQPRYLIEADRHFFSAMPGDIAYLSEDRFPSLSGQAANIEVRLVDVSKQISAGKTSLAVEAV